MATEKTLRTKQEARRGRFAAPRILVCAHCHRPGGTMVKRAGWYFHRECEPTMRPLRKA